MTQLKPELTIEEAQVWIQNNRECLKFLSENRTISIDAIAQRISEEIQRGHIARRDLDISAIDALHYVRDLKQRLVSMILNVFEKGESY